MTDKHIQKGSILISHSGPSKSLEKSSSNRVFPKLEYPAIRKKTVPTPYS